MGTDEDNTIPFFKSLRAKCISKFILFQISEKYLSVYAIILASGTRAVVPSKHTHLGHFTLTTIVSLHLPGEFTSGKSEK